MNKLLFTLMVVGMYQILPLLGHPALLLHWKMGCIILTAFTIWFSQPTLKIQDAQKHHPTDRSTVWLILLMAGVSTVIPEIEWAYVKVDQEGTALWNTIGISLITIGVALRIWSIATLGQFFTDTVQTKSDHSLITTGPYQHLRHPSYTGAYLVVIGCAVFLQAWIGFFIALLSMGYAYVRRIETEEHTLLAHFGEQYQSYKQNTWRLIPWVW
ncbi:MAG: isoprenylcysteine carboxylmethyltransferase family protein [Saprospiraceae bacterium]|nr:isoprenylcysteine carboxylmethyltransferase family protein [Saprospiraceae bacterium]